MNDAMRKMVILLCTSAFLSQGARGESCFDMGGVIVGSDSNEETLRRIDEFNRSVVEYFVTVKGGDIPQDILWEDAENLIGFLQQKGYDVELVNGGAGRPWFRLPLGFAGAGMVGMAAFSVVRSALVRRASMLFLLGLGILLGGNMVVSEYLAMDQRCDPFSLPD